MTPSVTTGQVAMIVAYCLLTIVWASVLAFAVFLIFVKPVQLSSRAARQVQIAFLLVAVILCVDSVYWAVTNTCRVLMPSWEEQLRNPWLVAAIKALTIVSGGSFAVVLWTTYGKLSNDVEASYFRSLADLTSDAIGILDADGNMKYWNAGAEELFGWRRSDVTGRHVRDFLVPQRLQAEIDNTLEQIKASRQALRNSRTSRLTSDGKEIPIDITISPIVVDREFRGYFGIMRPLPDTALGGKWIKFDVPDRLVSERYAFIAVPADRTVVPEAVRSVIKEAVAAHGLKPVIAEELLVPTEITEQIFSLIWHANVVVADLSGHNPNVLYEFGRAQAMRKPCVQIISSAFALPFDLAGIRAINYDSDAVETLRVRLEGMISSVLNRA